jgi:hypothetical protein
MRACGSASGSAAATRPSWQDRQLQAAGTEARKSTPALGAPLEQRLRYLAPMSLYGGVAFPLTMKIAITCCT